MKQRQYLKDYRPPAFRIPTTGLKFDIQENHVEVRCDMKIERVDASCKDLVLDGREMALLDLRLDGESLPASRYQQDELSLRIRDVPDHFDLSMDVRIDPYTNSSLEGLYYAGDMLCTQCESHGFSRITYGLDRPDVLSVYRVEIEAAQQRFPVLLSNGELQWREDRADGRHAVCWQDPHPKPSYLFAAVAGDLACKHRPYTTAEGREVEIAFYCDHGIEDRLDHAIDSLVRAMRWDEQRYGLNYDLNTYNVVVAGAFNMGAMENKGLNIFNPKYVLASPETATDADFAAVEAVIGHEYFHNWTGNRVTCRDWFQLSLKEGLTVFRDQQFSADSGAGPVQRIDQVRMLRGRQFAEDAGPLAHPVRPASYLEMNNFYTLTVYEKGAELVRLLHARLGEAGFRKGMDLYFARHDGQAVTIEDFLAAHGDANGIDTTNILPWYGQAGTPLVEISDEFRDGVYQLRCRQHVPGHAEARPVLIPIKLSLLSADGEILLAEQVLEFDQSEQTWRFELPVPPIPVLFEALSAPVKWNYAYSQEQLATILARAQDPFSRWEAAQRLYLRQIDAHYAGKSDLDPLDEFTGLLDDEADPAVIAALLTPPRADELMDRYQDLDPLRLSAAVDAVDAMLAAQMAQRCPQAYASLAPEGAYRVDAGEIARRSLRARVLELWVRASDPAASAAARAQYEAADNLTDRLAALRALNHQSGDARSSLLDRFYQRYAEDRLVLDRWFALQAVLPGEAGLAEMRRLLQHPRFDPLNPNRVRALIGSFGSMNLSALYAGQGEGLRLLAEQITRFDAINPQLASRLVTPFAQYRKLSPAFAERVGVILQQMRSAVQSPDVSEQLDRILED